jgi:hypothetical protein
MKDKRSLSVRSYFILPALFCMVASASVGAQTPADLRPDGVLADRDIVMPASLLRGGPMGELLSVYAPRHPGEIEGLLDAFRSLRELAEERYTESNRMAATADGRVRIMKEELDTTKTRLSVAKKAKNDADIATFTAEVKRQEAEKTYIERLRDALKADAAFLDSERAAAAGQIKALELEADVASKHADILASPEENRVDISTYSDLLRQMFNARRTAGDLTSDAGSRQEEAAARKLKQLDALSALSR